MTYPHMQMILSAIANLQVNSLRSSRAVVEGARTARSRFSAAMRGSSRSTAWRRQFGPAAGSAVCAVLRDGWAPGGAGLPRRKLRGPEPLGNVSVNENPVNETRKQQPGCPVTWPYVDPAHTPGSRSGHEVAALPARRER